MSRGAGELTRARVADPGSDRLAWAEGLTVSWPAALLEGAHGLSRDAAGDVRLPAAPVAAAAPYAAKLRLHAAFTAAPVSSRLPFSYRTVPAPVRHLLAGAVGRWQRRRVGVWARFPGWPLDLSADVLADLAGAADAAGAPAARTGPAPVVLTHDIDSAEGLAHLTDLFLPLEEAAGARSTSFVVPCAWPLDEGRLADVRARGHELGVHGYDHGNRTPFASPAERRQRLDGAAAFAARAAATGYRAPSLLRTRALLDDLQGRYRYDSSIPTSGGLFPVPNNGCASARPFAIGDVMELPLSLPRDGSLGFLGYQPAEALELWKTCTTRIARAGGVSVLLTHCETRFSGNPAWLAAYRAFLDWVRAAPDLRFALAGDVVARA